MEYRVNIKYDSFSETKSYEVWDGELSYGRFVKDDLVFESTSLSDCYAWIKLKQEDLFL